MCMSPPLFLWPASCSHILHQIGFCKLLYCRLSCNCGRAPEASSQSRSLWSLQYARPSSASYRTRRKVRQSAAMHASCRSSPQWSRRVRGSVKARCRTIVHLGHMPARRCLTIFLSTLPLWFLCNPALTVIWQSSGLHW